MPSFNAPLSDDAHRGWNDFAAKHGFTVVAFQEVLGLHLGDDIFKVRALEQIITEARVLAHQRGRAGGPRRKTG